MKKIILYLLSLIILVSCFSGCFNKENNGNGDNVSLRFFINGGGTFEGKEKDSIWKKIEEKTGVTLKIYGANHDSDYYTVLNPKINTGDFPDLFFCVPNNMSGTYQDWADQKNGVLYNIDTLLNEKPGEYPYVERILKSEQYKNIMFDNAHTLIPVFASNNSWGIYYRTDWLINVGYVNEDGTAKTPTTMDEFQEVLKLFTENDPDGNEQDDTWGISPSSEPVGWNPIYSAFGVTPDYDIYNGEVKHMYTTEEFKNFLTWANQMYKKGYIYPQFNANTTNQPRDHFVDGKVGVLITNAEQHVTWIMNPFESKNGVGKVIFGVPPMGTETVGKAGCQGFSDWGAWWGGFSIPLACKDPHAVLRVINYLYSPEGNMLRTYGIEGVHYTVSETGEITLNVEARSEEPSESFMMSKDANGRQKPLGKYKLGSSFGEMIDWSTFDTDGKIGVTIDSKMLDLQYYELIDEAISKNISVASSLGNVTAWSSSIKSQTARIEETAISFVNNAILGSKNLTDDWTQMLALCDVHGYQNVKASMLETVQNLGLGNV